MDPNEFDELWSRRESFGEIRFACDCGAVAGTVSARGVADGRRYTCHCTDCQAFAHYTHHADAVLDAHGGTDILQVPAVEVALEKGGGSLAAVHLTDRPLVRWSCGKCQTPLANTLASPKWPFYSMILASADAGDRAAISQRGRHVFTEHACGEIGEAETASMLAMGLPILMWIVKARLTGRWRRHPLFDAATLEPLAEPRRLGAAERAALDETAREWCASRG